MSGFKLLTKSKWEITEADPTIWIKYCSDMTNITIGKNDLSSKDPLSGQTVTTETALLSIAQNFNDVNSSYLRFASYPADPANPGTPEVGDSTFTAEKAKNRTIDVCFTDPSSPFQGGSASLDEAGDSIIGCTILIKKNHKKSAKDFIRTLTHELGHCSGLDHPQETRNAIMSYFSDSDEARLMIDDKMGLVYLFPKAGVDVKEQANFGLSCATK